MSTKSALIVDDSTTAQYRLKKMLRSYNLHIDVVDTGEAALRYLASNEPDVIFMDHMMPGMDGFRVLQIIKSHPETATIPVIMYTSKSGDVYTGQARALGALDVVSKDTINASDLSKVMEAIHIYREQRNTAKKEAQNKDDDAAFVARANQVSDAVAQPTPTIERTAPAAMNAEQARNLELRLSHLEHTLEDSRRIITSRVVRELQGLRQNIKQEFSDILAHQPPAVSERTTPEQPPSSGALGGFGVLLLCITIGISIYYFEKITQSITESQAQQANLASQVKNITSAQQKNAEIMLPGRVDKAPSGNTAVNDNYLADLAWAFNQSAALPFAQTNVDPKVTIRLHEFMSRIINSGFKGNVLISVYVGNFCLVIDNSGQAQLPPETGNMANCMLSNEIYGVDRVMKQYTSEIETIMNNLSRQQKQAVNIVINGFNGTESYPDRQSGTPVKDWNAAAQANNRIELRLEASHPEK